MGKLVKSLIIILFAIIVIFVVLSALNKFKMPDNARAVEEQVPSDILTSDIQIPTLNNETSLKVPDVNNIEGNNDKNQDADLEDK